MTSGVHERTKALTMVEARVRIWERLAATARADVDNGDWTEDEADFKESDHAKYMRACEQVADSIDARLARLQRNRSRTVMRRR